MTGKGFPRVIPVADHAVLIEFAETLDDGAHAAVLGLDRALARAPCEGLRETVPAYVSLLIDFDPMRTDHAAVAAHARQLLKSSARTEAGSSGALREVEVDVCYGGAWGPDLAEVARRTGLAPESVITMHLSGSYRVYMYGFAPGYAYLGGVPEGLRLDRKPSPVRAVPAGSVLIAGPQCLVSTLTMPTGWWIIGRSPTPILAEDRDPPFLLDIGDRVRFRRISPEELDRRQTHAPRGGPNG